tara:strand:+ start:124 stop:1515 length:1392 start_codon:yes stop_codon:yes gene_type:complete
MPSRYYNPRLAKNLAEAYKQEVYDFATPVEEGFKPLIELTKKRDEQRIKEKEKYDLQKEKIQKEQTAFFKDMPIVDPKVLDSSIRDFATKDMFNKQQLYRQAVETLTGYDRVVTTKNIANDINYWKNVNTNLASYQEDYIDRHNPQQEGGSRMSKVNDAVTLEIDRRKANKEFDVIEKDGKYFAVFEPQEDSAIEETTMIDFDAWDKSFIPVERQTKKYVDTIDDFEKMIDVSKRELRWEDDATNLDEIEKKLDSLEFTKDEALSIAVDFLGKEQESYAGEVMKDLDGDGVAGTIDDINMFIKDQLRQGVKTKLTDLRKAYENQMQASTDVKPPTATEIKEQQRTENYTYVGDALEQFKLQMQEGQPDIIKDQINWLQAESTFFKDMASGMGFSGFVNVTGDNDEVIAVEVTNEVTNNKAYIPVATNTEGVIKRLMIAAGASPREADAYYREKMQALPGLKQD